MKKGPANDTPNLFSTRTRRQQPGEILSGGVRKNAGQIEQTTALRFRNSVIAANEFKRFLVGQKITFRCPFDLGLCAHFLAAFKAFEEIGNRHIEDARDIPEAAGADAIHAGFVFLDLLELDPHLFAQLLLSHADHPAPLASPHSYMYVYRMLHTV